MIKVMWPLEQTDLSSAAMRCFAKWNCITSAICRSDLGGNVPLDRLSHRVSRWATARGKLQR